jgi:type II secretory pathway component PulC
MKKGIAVMLLCIGSAINIWAQQSAKDDPFTSLLPAQEKGGQKNPAAVSPPQVKIEGVLWDSDMPQVIIDGDVYKVGDTLKRVKAKVYKIERNKVFIFYSGRLFEMGIGKKEVK